MIIFNKNATYIERTFHAQIMCLSLINKRGNVIIHAKAMPPNNKILKNNDLKNIIY